jgi:hypothetical protein
MSMAAGFRSTFLKCVSCGEEFGIAAATGKDLDQLPDPFEADCIYCKHKASYSHSARLHREAT